MPTELDPRRQQAERRGRRAELIAAFYLTGKLYRVLEGRVKTPVGEIDLIVKRRSVIAFVEVKSRDDETAAALALTDAGRRRITRAAQWWLAHHPAAAVFNLRFDVVIVPGGLRLPRHIKAAFDATGVV